MSSNKYINYIIVELIIGDLKTEVTFNYLYTITAGMMF